MQIDRKTYSRFKQVLGVLLTLVLVAFFPYQTTKAATKTYVIGTDVTYPPFEFANQANHYVGIDLELMKAIAKEEGFKVKIKPLGFNAAVQALEAHQIDGVMAGMQITPERQKKFAMSHPYYQTGVVAAAASSSHFRSLKQLKGQRVALKTGTAAATYAQSVAKKYKFKTVMFDDSNTMYQDVLTGNSAAAFDDQPVLQYVINQGMKLKIISKPPTKSYYGFATNKNQKVLLTKFNEGLAKIRKNGEYERIVKRYVGATASHQQASSTSTKSSVNEHTLWQLLKVNAPALASGVGETLQLTVVGIFFATLFGILLGLMAVGPLASLRVVSNVLVYIFRGLPLLVLALFIYNGIPSLTGYKISAFLAGIITLALNEGAYTAAFVKGGIEAVEVGQMEAARSLGLSYHQAMRRVILPQGLKIMVPSFINQFIITLKDTSILSIIGLLELTQTGKIIISRNLESFQMWTIIAVIYLLMITGLTLLSHWVERGMAHD